MADIIDLDFYRKFRVVLPVRQRVFSKTPPQKGVQPVAKPCRRRHNLTPPTPSKTKN